MMVLMYQAADRAVKEFPGKLNVISVTRDQSVDPKLCKNHLHIPIDDLDTNTKILGEPYKYAELEDIQAAVDFAAKHKVHIIHCGAGLSRSPAILYAILRSQGLDRTEAMNKVLEANPNAIPNKRMINFADVLFGTG